MSHTKVANNYDDSPPAPPAAGSRGGIQTSGGARPESPSEEETIGVALQETTPQLAPKECILLKEEEIDENQQLIKETMETYREDFLNEHCERKLLWEEVNSLRQQVHLLLSELTTARQQVASQSDELGFLQKQRNELISMLQEQRMKDAIESESEKQRGLDSASSLSYKDGSQSTWLCLICTYENPCQRQLCCEVCGSIRPKSSHMISAGNLESDQVKTKRRKCGKPGEQQWPSGAYTMQWKPKMFKYWNTLDKPPFSVHALNEMNDIFLGLSN